MSFDLEKFKSISTLFGRTKARQRDKDLEAYAQARKEGIQPDTTERGSVDLARAFSDQYGVPYDGSNLTQTAQAVGLMGEVQEYSPAQKKTLREEAIKRLRG